MSARSFLDTNVLLYSSDLSDYEKSARATDPISTHGRAGTVTVAGNPGVDMPKGTLARVLKQAGLK